MNFEARKAEILRRGKERIRKRKQAVMTVCIPLVLCISLGGLYLQHRPVPGTDETLPAQAELANTEAAMEEIVNHSLSGAVQVSGDGVIILHEDPTQVAAILQLLTDIQGTAALRQESQSTALDSADDYSKALTGYQLVCTDQNGVQTTYTLYNDQLTDLSAEIRYELTTRQQQALYKALGLPTD